MVVQTTVLPGAHAVQYRFSMSHMPTGHAVALHAGLLAVRVPRLTGCYGPIEVVSRMPGEQQRSETRTAGSSEWEDLGLPDWRRQICRLLGDLRIEGDEPSFRAGARTASLETVSLLDMRTPPHTVVREHPETGRGSEQFCKLSLQMAGSSAVEQDGRRCVLQPGDLALYVTTRPYRLEIREDQESLVVHFPQSFVNMSPHQIEQVTATRLSRDEGLGRVAVPLFEQLAQNIELLEGPHALSLVRSALAMLVTVLSSQLTPDPRQTSEHLLLHRAVAHIDENLQDPELSPGKVADALFVSVRQLHSRFARSQLTVASYIRTRRLEAIHQDLADPLLAHEPVHAISARHGLHDPSYVSKALKAQFGEAPSAYRARVLGC